MEKENGRSLSKYDPTSPLLRHEGRYHDINPKLYEIDRPIIVVGYKVRFPLTGGTREDPSLWIWKSRPSDLHVKNPNTPAYFLK